jgi:hypothetical protein
LTTAGEKWEGDAQDVLTNSVGTVTLRIVPERLGKSARGGKGAEKRGKRRESPS